MEHGAPLLEGEVGGDDDAPGLVPATDDVEEQVGGAAVAGDVPELIEAEQIGRGVAPEAALGRGDELLAQQIRERGGQRAEADGVSALEGTEGEILGEGRFADAGLPAQKNVLPAADEVERGVEMLVEISVEQSAGGSSRNDRAASDCRGWPS